MSRFDVYNALVKARMRVRRGNWDRPLELEPHKPK